LQASTIAALQQIDLNIDASKLSVQAGQGKAERIEARTPCALR
jgi:hypothetical protein